MKSSRQVVPRPYKQLLDEETLSTIVEISDFQAREALRIARETKKLEKTLKGPRPSAKKPYSNVVSDQPKRDQVQIVTDSLTCETVERLAESWRITKAAVWRFAVHELARRYGFPSNGLRPIDYQALNRDPTVAKPLQKATFQPPTGRSRNYRPLFEDLDAENLL